MTQAVGSGLGGALRERLLDRLRLVDRVEALEGYPAAPGEPSAERRAQAEALLRVALRALGNAECYELSSLLLAGGRPEAGLETWLGLQELAQAGLVSWDVGSGGIEPTPLLRELHALLAGAVREASEP